MASIIFGQNHARADESVVVSIRYLKVEGVSHYKLYLYSADGTLVRQLTNPIDSQDNSQDIKPVFTTDGKMICFTRKRRDEVIAYGITLDGKHLRKLTGSVADWYASVQASPSFGFNDYDYNTSKVGEPDKPWNYKAPDGSVEIVVDSFDENEPEAADETYYQTVARHTHLRDLRAGTDVVLASLPGCEGVGHPLKLSDSSRAVYLFEGTLRVVFFPLHLNSTDGTLTFALDLEKRRLVRLGPNWATVYPLPGAPAFYMVSSERYQPLGDGRTVNCSYLERWNSDFEKIRYALPKVALCGGASVYRSGELPLNILSDK